MADAPDCTADAAAAGFGSFVLALHLSGRDSFWCKVVEHNNDKPENLPSDLEPQKYKKTKQALKNLAKLSLCKLTGLNKDEYTTMLQKCGILTTTTNWWGLYTFKPGEL